MNDNRDDRQGRGKRGGPGNDRGGERPRGDFKPRGGGGERPPFRKREERGGDTPRPEGGFRAKPFDKGAGGRPPFRARPPEGGEQRGPRENRFASERPRFERREDGASGGGRPFGDRKPHGAKPFAGKPFAGKPYSSKSQSGQPYAGKAHRDGPQGERPSGGRPFGERSFGDRPRNDRPYGDRPQGERPRGDRSHGDRPYGDRPNRDRPHGERAEGYRGEGRGDAPRGDRPFAGKPFGAKPFGARPAAGPRGFGPKPFGAKPFGAKPFGSRPFDGPKPFDDRRPRFDRPQRPFHKRIAGEAFDTPREDGLDRVAKVMARAGVASRRDAEVMIEAGRVAINGDAITDPGRVVGPHDVVLVDGAPLPEKEKTRLWLYNKRAGLVTTAHDPEGRPTVFDNLPEGLPRVVSVGRLDINTEGLLLLTNDGGLAQVLAHPKTGWLRRYRVRAHGQVEAHDLDRLAQGITIDEMHYGPIEARIDRVQGDNIWLTLGLREGKNREVKRVLEHLGLQVNRLIRVSFGPFQLSEIEEGAAEEVRTRILRDQLGPELTRAAEADFDLPAYDRLREARSAEHDAARARPERSAPREDGDRPFRERPADGARESRFSGERPRPRAGGEGERPRFKPREDGERRGPREEQPPKRPPPTRGPIRSVWHADEDKDKDAVRSAKMPRRGADPVAARNASAERQRVRAGNVEDPSGRRVLVERIKTVPGADESEARLVRRPQREEGRPSFADRGPRPERFENRGPRPEGFENRGPRPPRFENRGPRPERSDDRGARPDRFENRGARPERFENRGPREERPGQSFGKKPFGGGRPGFSPKGRPASGGASAGKPFGMRADGPRFGGPKAESGRPGGFKSGGFKAGAGKFGGNKFGGERSGGPRFGAPKPGGGRPGGPKGPPRRPR